MMYKRKSYTDRLEKLFSLTDTAQPDPREKSQDQLDRPVRGDPLEAGNALFSNDIALIARIGILLTQGPDSLETRLKQVAETIFDCLGPVQVCIYRKDSAREILYLSASAGPIENVNGFEGTQAILDRNTAFGQAVVDRQTIYIKHPSTDKQESLVEIAVPIQAFDRVYGVLCLSSERSGVLTSAHGLVMEVLANQISLVFDAELSTRETFLSSKESHQADLHKDQMGWNGFLNGIDRSERIGFSFDQNEIIPNVQPLKPIDAPTILTTALGDNKVTPGMLQIEGQGGHTWTAEEERMVASVAQQVAQHIENLRLVAEADKYRSEAEQSARRLTRQGWDDFLDAIERSQRIGYTYDQLQVAPAAPEGLPQAENDDVIDLPIQVAGEPVGLFRIERKENQPWTEREETLASLVSHQLAQHIENMRLLSRSEHYRKDAEEAARRLIREGWQEYIESNPQPVVGFVYDQNLVKPVSSTDLGFSSNLSWPMEIREQVIGQICAADPSVDDERVQELVSAVAKNLSLHVESLRLLDETERSRQLLNRRAAELETVARVSTAAATILLEKDLAQAVVDLTKQNFYLYHTEVHLLDDKGENLYLIAGSGEIGRRMAEAEFRTPITGQSSILGRAVHDRAGVVVNDVLADADYRHNSLLPDVKSEMVLPMIVGERLLGVIVFLASRANRFSVEEMRIYNTLASQVAVAIQNARLYAEQTATVERLRELDQLKSSFLANMSHELRTPLNSILGFTQLIIEGLDGPLTEGMQSDLSLIDKNGRHLLNLINDVLDMAKIEAGRVNLVLEPTDIEQLLNEVMDIIGTLAKEKSLYLKMENHCGGAVTLSIDRTRMRQIFINLVGNAVKFTEKGGITIHIDKLDQMVRFRICDTGISIPPDKLETIFEAFSQVDTSTTRRAGGTGLGLPISRRLVELHRGRLWAYSRGIPGEGSTLYLDLPLEDSLTDTAEVI
ncbi:MAG: GAF domain-containing protein [Anaerolineaceae bacterium]|nr:GAF domain-containing protein [Anaerolineaceae bacterium]